ncbi:MAG: 2-amino-4-hydroxy-6-hydroxymethyldihydropteridine diphosphokinase [Acidobacteriota bacterium]
MKILLGLGGNVGDVRGAFAAAAAALESRFGRIARSSLWRSAPLGPAQPDYLNAALLTEIDCHPLRLLAICNALEGAAGRDRAGEIRWGPRPLDLDLLLGAGVVIESPGLILPHPGLHRRAFALRPAAELAPELTHPRLGQTLSSLAAAADRGRECERVGSFPGPG